MDPITGDAGAASPTKAVMLKKTLDFQQENAAKLLSGASQGGMESPQRTEALQAQGRGQKLDVTV